MKNSDVESLISRYACLDFSRIYGFPNPLPKDEYCLRNGLKFNGKDLSLTVKHISDFRDFTELLRVKHEDVFLRLFHDSFQGECRSWVDSLPAKSVRSFKDFWCIFLETWIEKTKFIVAPLSFQDFREWYDMYTDEEIDENFSAYLTSYLKSCQYESEAKIEFLESFADKLRKDIDVLEAQIQSYDFHDKDQFFQDVFQPKQKGESLVFYDDFHNLQLKSYVE